MIDYVKSSPYLSSAYVDISLSRWDIVTKVWEPVYWFQRLAIKWRDAFLFKTHGLCFIWVHDKANDSCCQLQAIQ